MSAQQQPPRQAIRIPLSPGQHILHLILTVCTFGLWGIVWIIRAIQGNKVWADTQPGYYGPPPPYGWQPPPPPRHGQGGYGTPGLPPPPPPSGPQPHRAYGPYRRP